MIYLLDSDTCSYLIKGFDLNKRPAHASPDVTVAISSVTAMELLFGMLKVGAATKYYSIVNNFLDNVEILPFDKSAATFAAQVRSQLHLVGNPIGAYDPMIAGHALSIGAVLVSNNTKHFKQVPGLMLENWF